MTDNFFNEFETNKVEVMSGESHQKPVKIKGEILTKAYPTVLKAAALAVGLSMSSLSAAQEQQSQDNNTMAKIEMATVPPKSKEDKKTTNFFNVANVEQIQDDGKTYYSMSDKVLIDPDMLHEKKIKKTYKKGEKELRSNAEPDRILQDTVLSSEATYAGVYNRASKSINIPYMVNDLNERMEKDPNLMEKLKEQGISIEKAYEDIHKHNDPNSSEHRAIKAHEEQHKVNDALDVYAPGLSAQQYAIINQYDEISANVAGLNVYISDYQKQIDAGKTKDEALKVFDADDRFGFYKDAIKNGLNPKSEEGKTKILSGCMDLWKNNLSKNESYKTQVYTAGADGVDGNSFQALVLGNDKELQKRVDKIFDNILIDGKPSKMSKYLPSEKPELSQEIMDNISYRVRDKTGLDKDDIATINQEIDGKTYREKSRNIVKSLSGRYKDKTPSQKKQTSGTVKTATKTSIPIMQKNDGR